MVMDSLTRRVRRNGPNPGYREEGGDYNFWDMRTVTGTTVTDESALALTPFFRGVQLIASTVAGLPIHVYQEQRDGTRAQISTPQTAYLWRRPNNEMTKQTHWEHVVADEVRGNGFVWVDKDDFGQPASIWHIDRSIVRVGRLRSGMKIYEIVGEPIPLIDYKEGGEIVHIPNWGNGLVGYDPVKVARSAIALGLSAQEYAERFFSQDGVPPGYLRTEMVLTPEESEKLAERWQKRQSGLRNARKIAVLSHGGEFKQLNVNPEESQMQLVRGFQGEEIARLLGIPPHMLGFTEKVTSWGQGIAEQGRGFVTFTLQSHINRVEQAIDDALLVRELTRRFVKFDTGGLLRGTTLQRYQAYALGWGRWLTANDIRRDEDLPPVEGGDTIAVGSNLIPIEDLGSNFKEAPAPQGLEE